MKAKPHPRYDIGIVDRVADMLFAVAVSIPAIVLVLIIAGVTLQVGHFLSIW